MKRLSCCVALGVLFAQAFPAQAQTNTNAVRLTPLPPQQVKGFKQPLPAFSKEHPGPPGPSRFKNPRVRMLGTNTPAFDSYAANLMIHEANRTRVKWDLQIPKALTTNDVAWDVYPTELGVD